MLGPESQNLGFPIGPWRAKLVYPIGPQRALLDDSMQPYLRGLIHNLEITQSNPYTVIMSPGPTMCDTEVLESEQRPLGWPALHGE